jgi:hypothetical protein
MTVAPTGGHNGNHKGPQGTHTVQKGVHRWSKETDGAVCNIRPFLTRFGKYIQGKQTINKRIKLNMTSVNFATCQIETTLETTNKTKKK